MGFPGVFEVVRGWPRARDIGEGDVVAMKFLGSGRNGVVEHRRGHPAQNPGERMRLGILRWEGREGPSCPQTGTASLGCSKVRLPVNAYQLLEHPQHPVFPLIEPQ